MGAGIDTTSPPVDGDAIARLTTLTRQLLEEQRLTNQLLKKELYPSKWVEPEEAARILGLSITKSKNYRKGLTRFRENGWLTIFSCMNPYRYSRKQVEWLANEFLQGEKNPFF